MVTTIQITEELKEELKNRKMHKNESYESVIWDLIEDTMELSEETLKNIEIAKKEIEEGKIVSLSEIKRNLGL